MALARAAQAAVGKRLEAVTRALAYLGGVVLASIALITVFSIIGRALIPIGLGPIRGDFELVEAGCALAVFFFLPWCQMRRGHVTVDLFVSGLPQRGQTALGLLGDVVMALVSGVIIWRLWLGFGEKFPYGSDGLRGLLGMGSKPFFPETTYELELPIWIPYGFAVVGAAVFFLVCLYSVWRGINWVIDGREGAL